MTDKPLSCGGKGPCCHVAYLHRHCEHCDVVIDLREPAPPVQIWPYYPQPTYPGWSPTIITSSTGDPLPPLPSSVALDTSHFCEVSA